MQRSKQPSLLWPLCPWTLSTPIGLLVALMFFPLLWIILVFSPLNSQKLCISFFILIDIIYELFYTDDALMSGYISISSWNTGSKDFSSSLLLLVKNRTFSGHFVDCRSCPIRLHCSHCRCVAAAVGSDLLYRCQMFFVSHIYKHTAQVERFWNSPLLESYLCFDLHSDITSWFHLFRVRFVCCI